MLLLLLMKMVWVAEILVQYTQWKMSKYLFLNDLLLIVQMKPFIGDVIDCISLCSVLPPFEDELGDVITPSENVEGGRDHALNQTDTPVHGHNEGQFSDELPEVRRDAVHNSEPDWGDTINDFAGVHEQSVPFLNRNENLSPIMEGLSVSGEGYFPSPARDKMPTVASADDLDFLNTGISLGWFLVFFIINFVFGYLVIFNKSSMLFHPLFPLQLYVFIS